MKDRIHQREVDGYEGKIEELAVTVGRLTYDQVVRFIGALAAETQQQAEGDEKRGRKMLARRLRIASAALEEAASAYEEAWDICLPHMTVEELD